MLYLSVPPTAKFRPMFWTHNIGVMRTPDMGNRAEMIREYPYWAADNGCFSQGVAFDLDRYLAWLDRMPREQCLFATAPDVVGDAVATWERSQDVLPVIRDLGYPAAYVAQDGIENMTVEWDSFDCLFIGGSTGWKLSEHAYGIVRKAKSRGKWTHMGRVNSFIRLRAANAGGYDSADGTMVAFGPDKRLPQLVGWLDRIRMQHGLGI